jgi:hypothetical protein
MTINSDSTYLRLRAALAPQELAAAAGAALRLRSVLGDAEAGTRVVLVAYGGGKDSSFALAFVRSMQLVLRRLFDSTFQMRVMTNRHAGMPRAVMENIDRVYTALGLYGDPDCEMLCVDGTEVTPFDVDLPLPAAVVERNRLDILMTGHRSAGDGRATFCNACNLSMARAFAVAAGHGAGADVIVTGDSPEEQRDYHAWTVRLARRLQVPSRQSGRRTFRDVLSLYDGISRKYFADVHGPEGFDETLHTVPRGVPERLSFFSIYDDTRYDSGSHWEFLTGYLGFVFDDLAFSFSESDCGNPALMAHLRGLRSEHRDGRRYAEGIAEYVEFGVGLMLRKDFPMRLIEVVRERYRGVHGVENMRALMERYAWESFGLTTEQLVCMVCAPFADRGAGLHAFLRSEHPALLAREQAIRDLLHDGDVRAGRELAVALEHISGLTVPQLSTLYRSPLLTTDPAARDESVLAAVRVGDPHKEAIRTRHAADGAEVLELISGR